MIEFLLVVVGFILLIKGSEFLISGSESIAKKLKINEIVIGLTIVSIGTSIPELFISINASINNNTDIIVGNVIGSNITNLLFIFGFSAIMKEIVLKNTTVKYEIPFMLFLTILLYILGNIGFGISRLDAGIFIILFMVFIYYVYKISGEKNEYKTKNNLSVLFTIIYILSGVVSLAIGSNLVVDNATKLAELLNVDNSIISLSLIAIGTSLPELITYVTAVKKGNSNIGIGNIIGSNILNIVLVLGITGIINPIEYDIFYNRQLLILFISIILLIIFSLTGKKHTMSKTDGLIYFILFIIYIFLLYN